MSNYVHLKFNRIEFDLVAPCVTWPNSEKVSFAAIERATDVITVIVKTDNIPLSIHTIRSAMHP